MAIIQAMPERFDVHINGVSGVSPNFWVVDKSEESDVEVKIPITKSRRKGKRAVADGSLYTRNKVWIMKGAAKEGGIMEIKDDIMNEVIGVNLQEAMGIQTPKGRAATPLGADVPYFLQEHNDQAVGQAGAFVPADKLMRKQSWQRMLDDPFELAEMGVLDYLIQNHDRHPGNWSGQIVPKGKNGFAFRVGVFDNGYGFRATRGAGHINDFNQWMQYERHSHIRYGKKYAGDEKYAARMKQMADRLEKFDPDGVISLLKRSGASPEQLKNARIEMRDLKVRIKNLNDYARSL